MRPFLTEREAFEALQPEAIVDQILEYGRKVSELERLMNLASRVLDGYGTSVEKILQKRESEQNG